MLTDSIRSWWLGWGLVVAFAAAGCVEDSNCYSTRTCPAVDAGMVGTTTDREEPAPVPGTDDMPASSAEPSKPEPPDTDDGVPDVNIPLGSLPPALMTSSTPDAGAVAAVDAAVVTATGTADAEVEDAAPFDVQTEMDSGKTDLGPTEVDEPADTCAENNGGCDPLTLCRSGDVGPECGACPTGYVGSGATRCAPGLLGLGLSHGTSSPAIDPGTASYDVVVPVFIQNLTLSPEAPAGATLSIHGALVTPGAMWTSPPLNLGPNTISILIEREEQPSSTYTLNVIRGADAPVYMKASNAGASDTFGTSVALSSDGNTLAVGAYGEASSATGVGGAQGNDDASVAGAVYVFTRSGSAWIQQAYVKASNTGAGDFFGRAVALSSDGNTLAVGADGEDSATGVGGDQTNDEASGSGAAYVFTRSGSGWAQQAYIKASNTGAGDAFGQGIALSSDGNTLAVGASLERSNATGVGGAQNNDEASGSGAVYVFTRSGNDWAQQAYVKASNTGAADRFGFAVSLSGDGSTLAVGAYQEDSSATGVGGDQNNDDTLGAGAVYVFARSGSGWAQQAYVKASNRADFFGWAVVLSGDGDTLAVGAPTEDSSATGVGGDQNSTDALGSGAVYVFKRNGTTWAQQAYVKASNTGKADQFGTALALSTDGNTLVVGAYQEDSSATGVEGDRSNDDASYSGAAYVFTRTGGRWAEQAYVKASNTNPEDYFGRSVAVSGDGTVLAVGAYGEDSSATGVGGDQNNDDASYSGAVYLYR